MKAPIRVRIRRNPEQLLDVTLQPLMFVLLFAFVFGGAIAVTGGNYREYIIGGVLVQSLAFGLTGPATAMSFESWRKSPRTGVAKPRASKPLMPAA